MYEIGSLTVSPPVSNTAIGPKKGCVAFISHQPGGHLFRLKKPGCLSRLNRYEIWRKRQECSWTGEGWEGLGRSGTRLAQHEQEGQRQISFGRTHIVRIARLGEVVQRETRSIVSVFNVWLVLGVVPLPFSRLASLANGCRQAQTSSDHVKLPISSAWYLTKRKKPPLRLQTIVLGSTSQNRGGLDIVTGNQA